MLIVYPDKETIFVKYLKFIHYFLTKVIKKTFLILEVERKVFVKTQERENKDQ